MKTSSKMQRYTSNLLVVNIFVILSVVSIPAKADVIKTCNTTNQVIQCRDGEVSGSIATWIFISALIGFVVASNKSKV